MKNKISVKNSRSEKVKNSIKHTHTHTRTHARTHAHNWVIYKDSKGRGGII